MNSTLKPQASIEHVVHCEFLNRLTFRSRFFMLFYIKENENADK